MSRLVVICPLILVGCMMPPAPAQIHYHALPLQPDNCGTPTEFQECMPVVHKAPPIMPVYSWPLPPLPDVPSEDTDGSIGPSQLQSLRPTVLVRLLNADGSESQMITLEPQEPNR
jgi:hypothetical protein